MVETDVFGMTVENWMVVWDVVLLVELTPVVTVDPIHGGRE